MRWLPCSTPSCHGRAVGGPSKEPLLVGAVSAGGYTYKCSACRRTHRLTPAQFASLPDLSPESLAWEAAYGSLKLYPAFSAWVVSHYMD